MIYVFSMGRSQGSTIGTSIYFSISSISNKGGVVVVEVHSVLTSCLNSIINGIQIIIL